MMAEAFSAIEIVADVVIKDFTLSFLGRILDEDRNCDWCARACAENIALFHPPLLALRACVPAQIEDVNGRELLGETGAQSVHVVAFNK